MAAKVTKAYKTPGIRENNLSLARRRAELTRAGYKKLGKGSRASAHLHPDDPNKVIRLAFYDGTEPNRVTGEEPQDGWLAYFRAFRRSRSKHFPKVSEVKLYDHFYEVEMERLRPATNAEFRNGTTESTDLFVESVDWARSEVPERVIMDLHRDNIMIRPATGDQVISDPWFISQW